jgi:hypothetical protein
MFPKTHLVDSGRKKPYTRPISRIHHVEPIKAKQLALMLVTGSEPECLDLIRHIQLHRSNERWSWRYATGTSHSSRCSSKQ